jgi:hypothetical protein
MSKKAEKGSEKKGSSKKGKKTDASGGPSVAAHPRASYQVRRAKGWGGIAGFAIAAYLSHKAGVPMFQLGLRAIAFGIAGYMLVWACAVTVWRHLVLAELRAAGDRVADRDPDLIPARAPDPGKATGSGSGDTAAQAAPAPSAAPAPAPAGS